VLVRYFGVSREGLISRGEHREEDGGVPTRMVPLSRRQACLHISVGGDEPGVFLYLPDHQVHYQQRHDGHKDREVGRTLNNLVRTYDLTINLTRSISVCTSIILICSSSDEEGSPRRRWTASDYPSFILRPHAGYKGAREGPRTWRLRWSSIPLSSSSCAGKMSGACRSLSQCLVSCSRGVSGVLWRRNGLTSSEESVRLGEGGRCSYSSSQSMVV
jgi:hypothetical protein